MTFTLIASDPAQGLLGVATASRSLAVGRSVPALDPTVGAAASQAWTNRGLRHHLLVARTSDRRLSPPEVAVDMRVDHHAWPVRELRQLLLHRIAEFDGGVPRGQS